MALLFAFATSCVSPVHQFYYKLRALITRCCFGNMVGYQHTFTPAPTTPSPLCMSQSPPPEPWEAAPITDNTS